MQSRVACPSEWFEMVAAEAPETSAVFAPDGELGYGELDSCATSLAAVLREQGSVASRHVAILTGRSTGAIVAMLAVLKTGAAYAFLDPRTPELRLRQVLADLSPAAIICDTDPVLPLGVPVLSLASIAKAGAAIEELRREDAAAYVVYTSGSTGAPKGVVVDRAAIAAYTASIVEFLDLEQRSTFASVSPLWTDLGNTAIYAALCTGGTLHIVDENVATSPTRFADYMTDHAIDCLKIAPSHLRALLGSGDRARMLPRRCLVLGGERLPWTLVDQIRAAGGQCEIINHYGPSEATVGVASHRVDTDAARESTTVPIGTPLPHALFDLVGNEDQAPLPGESAEIWIGGRSLARGYLNDPELTRDRFQPRGDSRTWYRSGDLGRLLPDGTFEILGRIDRQLKVRGFRTEPGELEAMLLTGPGVGSAYAYGAIGRDGETELIAAVVPSRGATIDREKLFGYLRGRLPVASIPSRLFIVDAIPLTDNGKVDEHALTARVEETVSETSASFTSTEAALALMWKELLGREPHPADNFFDDGGNSIAAIRLLAKVNADLGVEVPLHDVFERPTLRELAAQVDELRLTLAAPT